MTNLSELSDKGWPSHRSGLDAASSHRVMSTPRKRLFTAVAAMAMSALLAGCGEELSCSATPTKQLVDKITRDQLKKVFAPSDKLELITLELSEIITTDKTKTRTACKAKLQMALPSSGNAPADMPITYHVEKTDDGRLYVTIFGL